MSSLKKKNEMLIVFGGSFNPFSKAHGTLINLLKRRFKEAQIILLPSSDRFMIEKKHFQKEDILPLKTRLNILKIFEKRNKRVKIYLVEINNPAFKTYDSLTYLKKRYQDKEIFFALGSEKLSNLEKWYKIDELLKNFKFIILKRGDEDFLTFNTSSDIYLKYPNSFIFFNYHAKLKNISSTKIRELINEDDYKDLNELTYQYVIKELLKIKKL